MNIAMLSPSQNAYSETFIQEQKRRLKGNIFYYFGKGSYKELEGHGRLSNTLYSNFWNIKRKLWKKPYKWYYNKLLKESLKRNRIDLVFAQYGPTAYSHLDIIKELALPLIVHFHGYDASVEAVIKRNGEYAQVFEYAKHIIVVSKKMYSDIVKLGCPVDKVVYNVYGPNKKFLEVEPLFLKQQFVSVGRFVEKKAPYYLILSMVEVVKHFPKVKLITAGNGELLSTCKNLVKALGLEQNLVFIGVISPIEFRQLLLDSIAFVQHSITAKNGDAEGTPLSVLEASAAGLPVISTRHAGIPDIIIDERTGLLIEEHDVKGMAENMLKLLRNPELAEVMGNRGKENIRTHFNIERHLNVLNYLIEKSV